MVQANELRIGNWVLLDDKPYLIHNGEQIDDFCYRMSGIELSADILDASGFEHLGEPFRKWINDEIGVDITEGPNKFYFVQFIKRYRMSGNTMIADRNGRYIEIIFCPNPLQYLHQLMNLWHSLTGADLAIEKTIFQKGKLA